MAQTPYSAPVRSRSVDLRTVVASLDPNYRAPPDVYLYPNGRKFKEFPEDQSVFSGTVYGSSDGKSFYAISASQMTLYGVKP